MSSRMPHDLISTGRAARALGVTPQAIRNWIAAGKLRAWRVGSRFRVGLSEVESIAEPSVPGGMDAARASDAEHRKAMEELRAMGF